MRSFAILFTFGCLFLAGCGDYKLIGTLSRTGSRVPETTWEYRNETQTPDDLEQLAIQVAQTRQDIVDGDNIVAYVANFGKYTLIVAYEPTLSENDLFTPRKVMRFIVVSGQIYAFFGPTSEPFPDLIFERSANICARNALLEGGTSTLLMLGWTKPVMLKGVAGDQCHVAVDAYLAEESGPGDMLCRKWINNCIPE